MKEFFLSLIVFFPLFLPESFGFENLAVGKTASQSSTFQNNPALGAHLAVNNDLSQKWPVAATHFQRDVYWLVNLGSLRNVYNVTIYYRTDYNPDYYTSRFAGFSLFISTKDYTSKGGYDCRVNSVSPPLLYSIPCAAVGQYVTIYNHRDDNRAILELGEVQVFGCRSPNVYGDKCDLPCHSNCFRGFCRANNGSCFSCIDGYQGSFCNQPCSAGSFGRNCSSKCNTDCFDPLRCNHINGSCVGGCTSGWKGEICEIPCDEGKYGPNCIYDCGNCTSGTTCDRKTGYCSACMEGYYPPLCDRNKKSFKDISYVGNYTYVDTEIKYVVPVVAIVCCVVAVILVASVACIIIRRCKPKENQTSTSDATELKGPSEATNLQSRTSEYRRPKEKYPSALATTDIKGSSETTYLQSRNSEYLGVTNRNEYVKHVAGNTDLEDNPDYEAVDEDMYLNDDDTRKYEDIPIGNLQTEIQNMMKEENAAFKGEYESIARGEEYPCTEAKKRDNTKKNRFISTFPYDHSRIVLKTTDQKDSDYINANYIENLDGKRSYIAAQGPKQNTDVDFWKMVWQENVHRIVMVTNLKEGVKEQCVKYWPYAGGSMTKGQIEIWTENEKTYAFYAISKLKILHKKTKEERMVYHFHFTQWKHNSIPDCMELVIFQRHVTRTTLPQTNNLTLVHCSGGIGRTGTYIALDVLYQYGEIKRKINVPAYVKIMRKDRMSMIQTVDQYIAVYKALHIAFMSKDEVIPREEFHEHVKAQINSDLPTNSKPFRTRFNELISLKPQYSQKEYKGGNENIAANFTKTVLPVDKFRCRLPSKSRGRGDYYNAVFIQSYTKQNGLICAQFPLIPYTEDLLRVVYDFESYIIVSMKSLSEIESTRLWMPSKGSCLTVGDFNVSFDSTLDTSGSVKTTILSLNKMGCDPRVIQVFETSSWSTKNTQPSDLTCVLDLVTEVQKAHNFKQDCVITVLSEDGATKCGVFCTIFNALQEVQMDNEVDIFTIARQIQIRRPEIFSNMDDYQFCFKAVDLYLRLHPADKDDLYVNSEDWYADVL